MTPLQLNRETARIKRLRRVKQPVRRIDPIKEAVDRICQTLGMPYGRVKSECRKREIMPARFILAHELRKRKLTLERIAVIMGRKTHASVLHYLKQYDALKEVGDKDFMRELDKLK